MEKQKPTAPSALMAIFDKYCQRLGIEKDLIAVKAVFFLYYAGASAIMPYLFLHFYSIPLTVEEIGFLSALRPFTTFVCAPLWSVIADKYRLHKKVLLGAILVVMSLRFLFTTITKARYIAVVILVDEMIGSSVAPLLDAGALEVLGAARKDQYGRQRLWAGLGWGLTATAVGSISSACNLSFRFNYLVYVCFTIMAWAVAARFLNPSAEPNPPSAGSSTTGAATNEKVGVSAPPQRGEFFRNIKRILSSKAAALFAIATLSIGMATAVASTYNTVWVIELGGSSMIAGWMFFAAMCSELTFFWFTPTLLEKLGDVNMMIAGFVGFVFRLTYYSLLRTPWLIYVAELTHGITFATFWSGAVRYTNRIAQPELLASAQGLLAGLYSGLGNGTGAILGGELEKVFGMRIMFAIGAGWMVVIGIFFAVATKYMGPPPIQSPGPVEEAKSTEPASEALSSSTVPTAAFSHAAQHDEVELSSIGTTA